MATFDSNSTVHLLYPEWQGYGAHQEVYHGAHHLCNHVLPDVDFHEIDVPIDGPLDLKNGIIGYDIAMSMLDKATSCIKGVDPERMFMIGGTCACELAPISFLNNKYDAEIAVLWFDAHGDLNTPDSSPSNRLHGMPLRTLLGEGDVGILNRLPRTLIPDQVALVGARDLDPGEVDYIRQHHLPVFHGTDTDGNLLIDFLQSGRYDKVYIHFDLDVLEPESFPHVLVPTPGGLSLAKAIQMLKRVRSQVDIVGASIVEYCPKGEGGNEELGRLISEGFGL